MTEDLVTKKDLQLALADLATKSELKGEISALRTELKGEMADLEGRLKGEMANLKTELKGEISALRTELKGEISALRTELKGDMQGMERRILFEIGHALGIYVEQTRSEIGAIDDKYAPLPARVDGMERAMEEHRTDYGLHKRPRRR